MNEPSSLAEHEQKVAEWGERGPSHAIAQSEEYDRLTRDTIVLNARNYVPKNYVQAQKRRTFAPLTLLRYFPGDVLNGESFTRSTTAYQVNASGVLTPVAINTKRDGHYIGGVRSIILEGERKNHLLWSNNLTNENAAWTRRGVVNATKTMGPDAIANSATTITGIGAVGVDDVYQFRSGFGASIRFEPGFWLKKVTVSGTLRIQNPFGTGQWDINLATLNNLWNWVTRWHAAVTILDEFTSSSGGDGGLHFMAQAGAPIAISVWGCDTEVGTFSTSTIPTTTDALTRASDYYSLPFNPPPRKMTVYAKFVEAGSVKTSTYACVFTISNAAGASALFTGFADTRNGGVYIGGHDTVASFRDSVQSVGPVIGDTVELIFRLFGDGSVDTVQSINGAASTTSTQTAALAFDPAWSGPLLWLNSHGTLAGGVGFTALQKFVVADGTMSISEMENL